jgi:hypothetical protein
MGDVPRDFPFTNSSHIREGFFQLLAAGQGPWPKRLIIFVFAGFGWALRTCRNKMMIPKAPSDVIYIALSFTQKWSCLLKEEDRARITMMIQDIKLWLKDFKTSAYSQSNVIEI